MPLVAYLIVHLPQNCDGESLHLYVASISIFALLDSIVNVINRVMTITRYGDNWR